MTFLLRKASNPDIEHVKFYAEKFNLDTEDLDIHKLFIVEKGSFLAGFGRYKNYRNICEISTVGVVEKHRGSGVGKIIIEKLIESVLAEEIWLTTVFPDYFYRFGFRLNDNAPEELVLKTERICKKFNKPVEKNVYMKLSRERF